MSEMLEKVEDAINTAMFGAGTPRGPGSKKAARAAVEALREPSEGMKNAIGESFHGPAEIGGYLDEFDSASVWQAMIDHVLKES